MTTVQNRTVNTPLPPKGGAERSANEEIRKAVAECWFTDGAGGKQSRRLEAFVTEFVAINATAEAIELRYRRAVAEYGAAKATARCVLNNWSTLGLCLVRTASRPKRPPLENWQRENPTHLDWVDRHAANPAITSLDPCARYFVWLNHERVKISGWSGQVLSETRSHYAHCVAVYGANADEWPTDIVAALKSIHGDDTQKQAVL